MLVSGYPLGGEMLVAWPAVLLHSDQLAQAPQVFMAALGGVATTTLARGVGAARAAALCAGCLFVLTPALMAQMTTAYVDVTGAALAVAALAFLIRWTATDCQQTSLLLMSGLAAGLAAGTRHTGALLAITCCAGAAVIGARRGPNVGLTAGLIFAASASLGGGGWYVENLLAHGNPVYPFSFLGFPAVVDVSDLLVAPPGPQSEPAATLWSWAQDLWPQRSFTYEHRAGGLGSVFAWVGLPCVLLVAVQAVRRRETSWLLLLSVVLVPFLLQPNRWWARFTFVLAALAAVAIADVLTGHRLSADGRGRRAELASALPLAVTAAVSVTVLAVQPALFARTVVPTDGNPPIASWDAFTVPSGDRFAGGPERPDVLRGIDGARTVAVAVDEVARTGSLFGPRFERRVRPVDTTDGAAFLNSVAGADVLVTCRRSRAGKWAAEDARLRLVSDPSAEVAVWRVTGERAARAGKELGRRLPDVYCE